MQSKLSIKMFCQQKWINVDHPKSCEIALCLPHTTYGSTLSCFSMSSSIFYLTPQTYVSIPCHSAFTFVWLPTDPMCSLQCCITQVCKTKILYVVNRWKKQHLYKKNILEYNYVKDGIFVMCKPRFCHSHHQSLVMCHSILLPG